MNTTSRIRHSRLAVIGAAAVLAAVLAPMVADAQQPLTPVEIAEAQSENARADALDALAQTMYSTPRKFREAARLHQRAAIIRGEHPTAAESYRSAAWAFAASGNGGLATQMMVKAADVAARTGRIEQAANSYVDAALLAVEDKRVDRVPTMLARVHTVLSAPLVPEATRAKILERIQGDTRVAHFDAARSTQP
jgi:hypothetical protein